MRESPTISEMAIRLEKDLQFFNGTMPERSAIAWYGYLAALIEWGLISAKDHRALCDLLPTIENNPSVAILLGRGTD